MAGPAPLLDLFEKRKKLFGGEKQAIVQMTLTFETPPVVGFITEAENRPALEEIVAGLESRGASARPA